MVHNNSSLLLICGVMFMAFVSSVSTAGNSNANITKRIERLCQPRCKNKPTRFKRQLCMDKCKIEHRHCAQQAHCVGKGAEHRRKRRYTQQKNVWEKEVVTWRLDNDNNDGLTRQEVERVLEKAFNKWHEVTDLTFKKSSSDSVNITVGFVIKGDGKCNSTDGKGGSFGHSFYPYEKQGHSGKIHFDDDEIFTTSNSTGISLLWIALHQIGHSIGLGHSNVKEAVMYPFYEGNGERDIPLHYDDQFAAETLYGPVHPEYRMTTGCTDTFKAVFLNKATQKTYVINNDKVYVLTSKLNIEKGPIHISEVFSHVQKVDAAYEKGNGDVVLFSDDKYFTYNGVIKSRLKDSGNIHDKYNGLDSSIKRIDAAFIWPGDGPTYLFVGEKYYRYNERTGKIDADYPRAIDGNWNDIPANVDAVFVWRNKAIYFFKGAQYYRFNNVKIRVETNLPRSISPIWTSCEVNSLQEDKEEENVGTLVAIIVAILIVALVIALLCFLKHRGFFRRSEGTTQRRYLMQ